MAYGFQSSSIALTIPIHIYYCSQLLFMCSKRSDAEDLLLYYLGVAVLFLPHGISHSLSHHAAAVARSAVIEKSKIIVFVFIEL